MQDATIHGATNAAMSDAPENDAPLSAAQLAALTASDAGAALTALPDGTSPELPDGEKPDDEKLNSEKLGGEKENGEKSDAEEEEEPVVIELPKDLPEAPHDEKPTSREEDFALIDQTKSVDSHERDNAYKRLLNKYRGQIFNLIFKIIHDANEVDDLLQESFSKAFHSLDSFNKEFAFSTWLYRIATNSSIDYLRKRRLKTFSIDKPIKTKDDEYQFEIPDRSSEPDDNLMQDQRDVLVREAIAQLPPKYKRVIEMRHLQERTYEEIATELGQPLGTVKAHIFRAREMLYKMLRDKLKSY